MPQEKYETIIIGGGISGLSCARRLCDAGRDFLLISKNLGGRILSSASYEVNYGAAYATDDYKNVLKYVDINEPLKIKDIYFFDGEEYSNIFIRKNIRYIFKLIKFMMILYRFRNHLMRYRKQAPYISIKEYFNKDHVLKRYWKMPAKEFIKKHNLEELDELYGNPVTCTTAFTGSANVNAAYYLGVFFPLIRKTWIVNFKDTIKRLTKGYQYKIKIGHVYKVKKDKDGLFKVISSSGDFFAKNIVFAAPQKSLSDVYNLPKPHIQQDAYTFHISGIRKDIYQNLKVVIFRPKDHEVYMIWRQKNGEDIAYSKNPEPDFSKYYMSYDIINKIHWEPGIIIPKDGFIEQEPEKNLFIASDYNFSLMEDCFLTGLYAANRIIKSGDSIP